MEVGDRERQRLEDLADVAHGQILMEEDHHEVPLRARHHDTKFLVNEENGSGAASNAKRRRRRP